jgi:hypothetical protein
MKSETHTALSIIDFRFQQEILVFFITAEMQMRSVRFVFKLLSKNESGLIKSPASLCMCV